MSSSTAENAPRYDVTTLTSPLGEGLINRIEAYLREYSIFPDPGYALPLALWIAMSHTWEQAFDTVPYLAITAATRGAGKTQLAELLSFVCAKPRMIANTSVAAVYSMIADEQPTLLFDEAEEFISERSPFRSILNGGYRRGQYVTRKQGREVVRSSVFCPKSYQLIGDPCGTLRDRCIVIQMRRATAKQMRTVSEYIPSKAQARGNSLRDELARVAQFRMPEIAGLYLEPFGMPPFVNPRDREIWKPLFTLCRVLCPERLRELSRIAIDMAAAKTAPRRNGKELAAAEEEERDRGYAERLLLDMVKVVGERKFMPTEEIIAALRELETSPWRTFRGKGIKRGKEGAMVIASLLSRYGLKPKVGRVKTGTARGYEGSALLESLAQAGLEPEAPQSEEELAMDDFIDARDV